MGLERSGLPGRVQPWRDVLYDGPAPSHLPPTEFRSLRSAYIAAGGAFGSAGDIEREYAREDAAVAAWGAEDEMVLWFEHDLYDQLLLIRLLSMLPPQAGAKVSLVCSDTYLGPLAPDRFPALFDQRRRLTAQQIALGTRAWQAFGADTPEPLAGIVAEGTAPLPYLAPALGRFLEDYPSEQDGLSRSERQALRAVAAGATTPAEAFAACARMEAAIFMGDWTFWTIVRRLAAGASPLVAIGASMQDAIGLTPAGQEVLSGRADAVALNGIDRWMGGVHLTPERLWRRAPAGDLRPSS